VKEALLSDRDEYYTSDEFKTWNQNIIEEFRANQGRVGGMFEGANLLLLTAKGAKSGRTNVSPLGYTTDNGRYVVIASKGGAPTNPSWYYNVLANPDVTVEAGGETFSARAIVPQGAERQRLFDQMVAQISQFGEYQKNATRQLPVVVLERVR
jgi:deazaflavin-dependent oxidoreductase (nitroreductase family)